MKKLIIIIAISNILVFSQTSVEEKLEWIKSRGDIKVTESTIGGENDIYCLEYPDGMIQYFNLGKTESHQTDSIPTTVIETWNVDTMLYKDIYYFWQEVLVATSKGYELVIGDANKNGFPEIYGYKKDYEDPPIFRPVNIFEMNSSGNFSNKFIYPDSVVAVRGLYDIQGN
ncbi:MAG: hypothetical protein DRQ13_09070, partial [Ignavibacteriae bacterium]